LEVFAVDDNRPNPVFGIKEPAEKMPALEQFDRKTFYFDYEKGRNGSTLQNLAEIISGMVMKEVDEAFRNGKQDYIKDENYHKDEVSFHLYKCVHDILGSDFADGITAWVNGKYFSKQGLFENYSGITLVEPAEFSLSSDWADNGIMGDLAQEVWDKTTELMTSKKFFKKDIDIHCGCVSTGFINCDKPTRYRIGSPEKTAYVDNFTRFISDVLEHAVQDSLPYPVYSWSDKAPRGQVCFMYSDRRGLGWKLPAQKTV
jgi:hypothetical protein